MTAPDAHSASISRLPHAKGFIARLACDQARDAGIALPPLLKRANLTLGQIDDPRVPLKVLDQIRLLNVVADAVGDELLGFHLAQHSELRGLGLLYYVPASSQTLSEALQRTARYGSLYNEGVLQQYVGGSSVCLALRYVGVSRHIDCHQVEFWMTTVVRMLRQLSGTHIVPRRICLVHSRNGNPTELEHYFGREIEFGAAVDEMVLGDGVGKMTVVSADSYLNELLVHCCEEALAHRPPLPGSWRARVENAIVPLLPHAEVRATRLARTLGISERSLARRLREEGLSFAILLEQLRRDLAHRYLAEGDLPISQIAWLLGYQTVSAFSKAFKRWTGHSPRAARLARGT